MLATFLLPCEDGASACAHTVTQYFQNAVFQRVIGATSSDGFLVYVIFFRLFATIGLHVAIIQCFGYLVSEYIEVI